jgi:hypothetical protein
MKSDYLEVIPHHELVRPKKAQPKCEDYFGIEPYLILKPAKI